MHKREEAVRAKLKFVSPLGDHITLLNVFKGFCKSTLKKVSPIILSDMTLPLGLNYSQNCGSG